ncbi:MAG: TIR domain-containing protein [Prosthecobacter sp.]
MLKQNAVLTMAASPTRNFSYDVFLSHNAKDKPRVRQLAERLKQAGLRVWFDEWNIKHGDIIALKVDDGLEQSRVLLLCISPNALASGWVALERSSAIHRDPANTGRRFIPLLLADCDLPDTLRRYKYVDFREDAEKMFAELLVACQTEDPRARSPKPKAESGASAVERISRKKDVPKKQAAEKEKPDLGRPEEIEPPAVQETKFKAHTTYVHALAVSSDGKSLASCSSDQTFKIWNIETRKCIVEKKFTQRVLETDFINDGMRVLCSPDDTTIRMIDIHTGNELARWEGHSDQIRCFATTADGQTVVSGSDDESLKVWDVASGRCKQTIVGQGARIFSIANCFNDTRSLAGDEKGTIKVWELDTGTCLGKLSGHRKEVFSIKVVQEKQIAISGSNDATLKIWDLNRGCCVGTLEGHQAEICQLDVAADGDLIASTSANDHSVRLWSLARGKCLQVISHPEEHFDPISVTFSPEGSRLFIGTTAGTIYVYRLTGGRPPPSAKEARRYVNAKVVLLGEGTVGKTSLAHRLIEDQYVIRDRTHGMKVWRFELPLPPDATRDREALLWDLAGQEDYRLIHPLFLQETALALLLVNPQNADPFREVGDWLKMLKCAMNEQEHQREANRLLILSQVDVGGPKLSDAKLEQFCRDNGFTEWLPTSSKTGENCSDQENKGLPSKLKKLIAASIPWDKLPWTVTDPPVLTELKNAVMAMRAKTDIRLLRFAELAQRLEQTLPDEKFGESDVRTAVTLLANHGLARPLKFGDLVLLQPELLNGYASAIIRAARVHTDEIGCVLETDIYHKDFDFTGVERLKHRPDEELLLRALVQTFLDHSLCIAEDTPHGRHLVFPSQYRREKDIPRDPDIFVSYTFCGEWQTVWTTLIVRLWYSQEFQHRELWRNAAEFESPKGFTLGLKIDNQQGEGMAKISLYFDKEVEDVLKVIFIEYVHRHLAKYGYNVTRDRRYICPECGTLVKDTEAVRRRKEAGKEFINCQECDDVKVPFIDFIEQRLKSDHVARKILAMDEVAKRELDTQALEQILIGHMMAITGEANQIFRPVTMFDHGIDGEVEFKDNDGKASGKRIYIQLKSGNSYLRTRKSDGREVFDVKDQRHLEYWVNQPVEVYLVIRQTDEVSGGQAIRWMNVTHYLKARQNKKGRQIIFSGEKLDMEAVWKVRDEFFPPKKRRKRERLGD